jgi:hypothetical protein
LQALSNEEESIRSSSLDMATRLTKDQLQEEFDTNRRGFILFDEAGSFSVQLIVIIFGFRFVSHSSGEERISKEFFRRSTTRRCLVIVVYR